MVIKMNKNKPQSDFKYSQALQELEEITTYLESNEIDLDEAIKRFDRGSELAAQIEVHLQQAENKVETIKSKPSNT